MPKLTFNNYLFIGGLLGAYYLYLKAKDFRGDIADALNPTKDTNLIYRGASYVDDKIDFNQGWDDKIFATLDLINPWNESDDYAKRVWGIGE